MRPILYSFRRCPYAIRARLALAVAAVEVQHREVSLKNKPASLLRASAKATVPILCLPSGEVIDESLDIMRWALSQRDPEGWLKVEEHRDFALIHENDTAFKAALDRYKYASRFPEHAPRHYRAEGEVFLRALESRLKRSDFLTGARASLVDFAILPFIRQFAFVDKRWFDERASPELSAWLTAFLQSPRFIEVMIKRPVWQD